MLLYCAILIFLLIFINICNAFRCITNNRCMINACICIILLSLPLNNCTFFLLQEMFIELPIPKTLLDEHILSVF